MLDGAGSQIPALSGLTTNAGAGTFAVLNGGSFTTAGTLTNAGTLTVGAASTFTVPFPANRYTQSGGSTIVNGTLSASAVDLQAWYLDGQIRVQRHPAPDARRLRIGVGLGEYDVLDAAGIHAAARLFGHDRELFASRAAFEERLRPLGELARHLGAVGFRSPATHRVFDWLGELPVDYDCTMPNSDPYEPLPGGCCSVWPFFIDEVVELPYTLPQDHTLLTLLARRTPELWLEAAAAIECEYGLIQCVSHPDTGYLGDADKRAVYAEFLSGIGARPALWRALPREVAAWWRSRASAASGAAGLRRGIARLDGEARVVLLPPA